MVRVHEVHARWGMLKREEEDALRRLLERLESARPLTNIALEDERRDAHFLERFAQGLDDGGSRRGELVRSRIF